MTIKGALSIIGAGAFALTLSAVADTSSDEMQIKALVNTELKGAATQDIDKVMSGYWNSPDFILYEAQPFVIKGYDNLKTVYLDYFKTFPKAEAHIEGLHVGVSGDLGYAFSLQTWKFVGADGKSREDVHRVTNIFKKIGGHWFCIFESDSIPMNIGVPIKQ